MNIVCVLFAAIGQVAEVDSNLPTLDVALSAHNDRIAKYVSVQLDWTIERTLPSHSEAPTVVEKHEFRQQGTSLRIEQEGDSWWIERPAPNLILTPTIVRFSHVAALKNGTIKSLDRSEGGHANVIDAGEFGKYTRTDTAFLEHLIRSDPFYLTQPRMAVLRMEDTPEGSRLIVGTTDYNRPNYVGATRKEFYLDPDRGYILTAFRTMKPNGEIVATGKLQYSNDPDWGVIPSAASVSYWSTDAGLPEIESRVELRVTGAEFGELLPEDTFDLEFPTGTLVFNRIEGTEYAVE